MSLFAAGTTPFGLAAVEKASKEDRELVQMIAFLATSKDRIPRLRTLGIWRAGVEDHDF